MEVEEYESMIIFYPADDCKHGDSVPINSSQILKTSQASSLSTSDKILEVQNSAISFQTIPGDEIQGNRSINYDNEETSEIEPGNLLQAYERRIEIAVLAYYHHQYPLYHCNFSESKDGHLCLKKDIILASRIPNHLQETFEGRLSYLLNDHNLLLTKDAIARPADHTDKSWQDLLKWFALFSKKSSMSSTISVASQDSEEGIDFPDDDQLESSAKIEDEEMTFRSVVAQGAGAYLFTTILPVTLGVSSAAALSLPTLTIAACVGAVAGQVAWDSVQQQRMLYPCPHPSALSKKGGKTVPNTTVLKEAIGLKFPIPPQYPPALKEWRKKVFVALALSEAARRIQRTSIEFFTNYWMTKHFPVTDEIPLSRDRESMKDDWEVIEEVTQSTLQVTS